MTEEQLQQAILLKSEISRHEEIVNNLVRYRKHVDIYMRSILDYFCTRPLYDPSLHQTFENLLDKEIASGIQVIRKLKETLSKI